MSYIVVRGRWYNITVLNVHAPSEEKGDNSKDGFLRNKRRILFIIFQTTKMKILLGDLNWGQRIFSNGHWKRVCIGVGMLMVLE